VFQKVVWHLAGKGWSAEQITDELARHPNGIGAKYADRLHAEVNRSYEKWRSRRHAAAAGGAASPVAATWPQIFIRAGELPRVVDEAEDALLLLGREMYQRGGLIVRPVQSKLLGADDREVTGWQLIPVVRQHLVETLCCAAQFFKYDARAKGFVVTDAPEVVAETYLSRRGRWRLPVLTGIVNTPFLRADGSICERPGYDAESGLLFKPDGESFPAIPLQVTKDDAAAALAALDELIATFPFVTKADRSVALSAMLTTLDRHAMATAPLHGFTSPAAGTGKSLLVDIAATLATGRRMPVISQGRTEEELEKRLGAALLAGDVAISIDNCEHRLESGFLCQALTQRKLNIRVLGQSKNVETPVNATIFATGNNLTIAGDLTRRSILCSMDAHCERPELRTFDDDALKDAQTNRGQLVAAALTILRAWHLVGERVTLSPFGSFDDWSRRIREPLVWLGCADPCDTVGAVRESDPKRQGLATVVMQWKESLTLDKTYAVQEVIGLAIIVPEFHAALLAVAADRSGKFVSNERLGRWLRQVQGKIVNGLRLLSYGMQRGYPLWKLTKG
jgi:putative DNA primase/helicase